MTLQRFGCECVDCNANIYSRQHCCS